MNRNRNFSKQSLKKIKIFLYDSKTLLKLKIALSIFIICFSVFGLYTIIAPKHIYAASVEKDEETIKPNEIIKFINIERNKFNLPEIKYNSNLMQLAEIRIIDMKKQLYFSHVNPQGKNLKDFIKLVDYNYMIAGENLAMNYYNNEEVVQAWMESPTHRDNILRSNYNDIGISYGEVEINGKNKIIIAMILGRKK